MNDRMIFDNYLLLLKSDVEVYVHGTLESTNKKVRNELKNCLDETMSMQNSTYTEMTNNNWYKIENINTNEIQKVINKLEKCN